MAGNFLTAASTAGIIWGIFQHWNAGASWNFTIWSGILLISMIFYHHAERSTNRTHNHPDEQNFTWKFQDGDERPKSR